MVINNIPPPQRMRATPPARPSRPPAGTTFSARTNSASAAIQRTFIRPPTNSSAMMAQQRPRQKSPCRSPIWKAPSAPRSVMGTFGLWVGGSTIYSAFTATVPKAEVIGSIGLLALAVNLAVAGLLYRYRDADSQAMSVWLCTRNDCIANIAVMLAGAGVWASATAWPDIAVAAIIACLGLSSAVRVIRQALIEMRVPGIARGVPAE